MIKKNNIYNRKTKKQIIKKYILDDPKKYLIVNANNITIKGDECNKVGVSYEAFYKQYNRCGEPRSSCLKNQPSHLWEKDMVHL